MLRKKNKTQLETFEQDVVKKIRKERKLLKKILAKNEDHLLFTGFVMVMTAIVVITTVYLFNRTTIFVDRTVNSGTESSPSYVLRSSDTATTDSAIITIKDVSEKSDIDRAFTIPEDETFLIFNISITNNTPGEQDLYPVKQLYVRSKDGDYYSMHITSFITTPLEPATLKPGETASGQVSFAVPKTLANPLVYVDLGWNDIVPTVYDVLR
jgi:hypothetical protein